jgi:hypothetical protein
MVTDLREAGHTVAVQGELCSSDRSTFMAYAVARSDLNHYQAYRLSRVFDAMQLILLTRQLATFDRVNEYRNTVTHGGSWDEALRRWIDHENQERAENSKRYGVQVEYLPAPGSVIGTKSHNR